MHLPKNRQEFIDSFRRYSAIKKLISQSRRLYGFGSGRFRNQNDDTMSTQVTNRAVLEGGRYAIRKRSKVVGNKLFRPRP